MNGILFRKFCNFTNKWFSGMFRGFKIEWDERLERDLEFIELSLKPEEVIIASWSSAIVSFLAFLLLSLGAFFLGVNPLFFIIAGTFSALVFLFAVPKYPGRLASLERMKALGYAPTLLTYLVIPLKQDPNLERAATFAAEHSEGRLGEEIKKLVWGTWSGDHNSIDESLPILGYKWGEHVEGLKDSIYAIRSSQAEKFEDRRLNTLDRALESLLDNIQKKFQEFMDNLKLPTNLMFMMGVLFPMLVLMFIPALSVMGMSISDPFLITAGLLLLLVGIFIMSEVILQKRPVAFSPIEIPDDYPGLPSPGKFTILGREASVTGFSMGVAIFISLLSLPYFLKGRINLSVGEEIFNLMADELHLLPIVLGIGTGLWIYFRYKSLPKFMARERVKKAEDESIEASFHLGNRLMSGMPAEEALVKVSALLSNPTKDSQLAKILKDTAKNMRYMDLELKAAFFDPQKGSLRDVHSGLISGIFNLFVVGMERGITSGSETLITVAEHFKKIKKVERSLRDKLGYTTSMMRASATVIAPALSALAIPISRIFRELTLRGDFQLQGFDFLSDVLNQQSLSPEFLTLLCGLYVLAMLVILIRFCSRLQYGQDQVMINLELSRSIPVAMIIFTFVLFTTQFFMLQLI
jgi:hypothetical protein